MADIGILSLGTYVPSLRLERAAIAQANRWANPGLAARAKGRRAMLNWDEDSLTMGVEAARACLAATSARPESVTFASTTAPFMDRPCSVLVCNALQLPSTTATHDVGFSQRAASSALIAMLAADDATHQLLVAADARPAKPGSAQELSYGAGAAAALVGRGDPILTLRGHATKATDFVDHYRTTGATHEYHWEERWVRDEGIAKLVPSTIVAALEAAQVSPSQVKGLIFPTTLAGAAAIVAKRAGLHPDCLVDGLASSVGDTGNAHLLLMLESALKTAAIGDILVVATFGYGCDVAVLEVMPHLAAYRDKHLATIGAVERSETSYQKYLSFTGEIGMDWGVRSEFETKTALSAQYRYSADAAAFLAGTCSKCGTIQFPRAEVCVNAQCDFVGPQTPVSLLDEPAEILTFTADWLSFKGAPPFCFGLVQFTNGARALMEFADVLPDDLAVGIPLRFVLRKKEIDTQRAYHSYFWKAVPTASQRED